MARSPDLDRLPFASAVEYQWRNDQQFRREWTCYMRRNARAKEYPDWYGRGDAWLPTTFHARFGNRIRSEATA